MAADPSSLGEYKIIETALLEVATGEWFLQHKGTVPAEGTEVLIRCSESIAITLDGFVLGFVPFKYYEAILEAPEEYRGTVAEAWMHEDPFVVVHLARSVH
jgi:hypothetical protein